jgi:glycosyltransferase involved in cell wall biosynthesis
MIKVLLFSTLYPSAARPVHGIFVETRLRELLKTGEIEARVVAPVPWFPFKSPRFGEYAQMAATPREEHRNGLQVFHPRYFLPPKLGMNIAPYTMAAAAWPTVQRIIADGFDFDLIDAHYYYPDGVAAAILARRLNKPFVVTARGTDLSLIPDFWYPRRMILRTARLASASIGVCQALMERLETLGADSRKLHIMRNGVDLDRFRPEPTDAARAHLGLPKSDSILLSVGHLIERKGHHIAIEAMSSLPMNVRLVIVGTGADRRRLEQLAAHSGVADRVTFAGQVPQDELRWWYSAADALVLCSSREGWANVLLESMACGTPVLASNIWGTPEIVSSPEAGVLLEELSAKGLISAWSKLEQAQVDRARTRQFAEHFSWHATSTAQLELFARVVQRSAHGEVLT